MFHLGYILFRIQRLLINSVDPDETVHDGLPHLDLYYLQIQLFCFCVLKAKSTEIKRKFIYLNYSALLEYTSSERYILLET